MDLVFCTEARFVRHSSALVYSIDGGITCALWERYLTKFEHIYVIARVLFDENMEVNEKYIASNERVSFIDLPYYVGPLQYLQVRNKLKRKIAGYLNPEYVYICRVPGEIGNIVSTYLKKSKIAYGVEVVGDPWEVFAPGAVRHLLRSYFRCRGFLDLRKVVAGASAALYVTNLQLQLRYPVSNTTFQVSASNVYINSENSPSTAKKIQEKNVYNLLSIGSLEQMYKAPDVVLKALSVLIKRGISCRLIWLGEGKCKNQMQKLAAELCIESEVCFRGNVPRDEVNKALSEADMFLLVSRTEGLPRALIEAMSMGLPCIGTNVGGIPELLDESALISKDNIEALANKIEYMIKHLDYSNCQAQRNFEEAAKYDDICLQKKREAFYEYLISTKNETIFF